MQGIWPETEVRAPPAVSAGSGGQGWASLGRKPASESERPPAVGQDQPAVRVLFPQGPRSQDLSHNSHRVAPTTWLGARMHPEWFWLVQSPESRPLRAPGPHKGLVLMAPTGKLKSPL